MGEEDSAPLRASPDLADAVLERVRAHRAGASLAEIVDALDRCDDPGGPGRRWWTLDPVDGTKGFLRDEQYAVALALIEDGEVVLAVMGSPNLPVAGVPGDAGPTGCLFLAERGRGRPAAGARRGRGDAGSPDAGVAIAVAPIADAGAARYAESVEAAHSSQSVSALVADRLGITAEPLRLDSQTKYAVVARGDASIYLRFAHGDYRENVWDHAAGSLIVTEAGGRVTDAYGSTARLHAWAPPGWQPRGRRGGRRDPPTGPRRGGCRPGLTSGDAAPRGRRKSRRPEVSVRWRPPGSGRARPCGRRRVRRGRVRRRVRSRR